MKTIYSKNDVKKFNIYRIIVLSAGFLIFILFSAIGILFAVNRSKFGRPLAYTLSSISGWIALSLLAFAIIFFVYYSKLVSFIIRSLSPSKRINGLVTEIYKKPVKKDGLMFKMVLFSCDDGIDRYLYIIDETFMPQKNERKSYYVIHNNFVCGADSGAKNE